MQDGINYLQRKFNLSVWTAQKLFEYYMIWERSKSGKIGLDSSHPCHSSEEIRIMSLYNSLRESGVGQYMCNITSSSNSTYDRESR